MKFQIGQIKIELKVVMLFTGLSLEVFANGKQGNFIVNGFASIAPNNPTPVGVRFSIIDGGDNETESPF